MCNIHVHVHVHVHVPALMHVCRKSEIAYTEECRYTRVLLGPSYSWYDYTMCSLEEVHVHVLFSVVLHTVMQLCATCSYMYSFGHEQLLGMTFTLSLWKSVQTF
jgi:hypothetical protein